MVFSRTKKYLGILLALAIVFGCLSFNPGNVEADTGIQLGKTYSITEADYSYQFGEYCAAVKFVPEESGYYLLSGNIYLDPYQFDEWGERPNYVPRGYEYLEPCGSIDYFNMPDMFNPDMQEAYYLEGGVEYYFLHPKDGCYAAEEGEFCFRKIEDYISVIPFSYGVAFKGDTVNCWVHVDSTVEFSDYTCSWYTYDGFVQQDHELNSTLMIDSDELFDDEDFEYGNSYYGIYCLVEYTYGGEHYSHWIYGFYATAYTNELDAASWAGPAEEDYIYIPDYNTSDKFLMVNAASISLDYTITYEWYSKNYRDDSYELIPGASRNRLNAAELGLPSIIEYGDYWYFDRKQVYCKVTFQEGDVTAVKKVYFDVTYGLDNPLAGSTSISVEYGDTITFPGDNGFTEPLKSEGITYEYQWLYYKDWNTYQLGTNKTVTFNTEALPVFHDSEGDYSEFYCECSPYYNGKMYTGEGNLYREFKVYYTDLTEPDTSGIAINTDNFPDDRFRQYVSDNFDVNKSGYLSESEIENVTFIDVSDMNLSNLKGVRLFGNLNKLYCSKNAMEILDLSGLGNLKELRCDYTMLEIIDLSGCRDLRIAYITRSHVTEINIDDCPYLKHYYEYGPQTATMADMKYYGLFEYDSNNYFDLIYGIKLDEQIVVENAQPFTNKPAGLEILTDPHDFEAQIGDIATFTVTANSEDVNYRWQYLLPGTDIWINAADEGYNTDTISIPVVAESNGVKYRCIVSDGNETVQSDYATLFVLTHIRIFGQPMDYIGLEGTTAKFSVDADGEGLTYQWQLKKGSKWADLTSGGATTSTMSIKVDASKNGKVYRCVITDEYGFSVTTNEVSITVKEPSIKINTQPKDYKGIEGSTAKFTVDAEGEGLTYQWQLKKGKNWANLTSGGATTSTMSIKVDASKNGKIYRCLITDENGEELATNEVSITVKEPSIFITSQPSNYVGTAGNTARFSVAAEGEGLTYQWQLKKGKSWANLSSGGATTSTMSINVDESKNGKVYRCLITNADGEELASNEVSITIKEPAITIITQPKTAYAFEGDKVKFRVEAEGEGLTYQWQLKKGKSWADLTSGGATTNELTVKVDSGKFGKTYRCVISNSDGEQLATEDVSIIEFTDHTEPPVDPEQQAPVNNEDGPIVTPVTPSNTAEQQPPESADVPSETAEAAETVENVTPPAEASVEAPVPAPVEPEAPVEQPAPAGDEAA